MHVTFLLYLVFIKVPFGRYAIGFRVFQCSETQVVEDGFHAIFVCFGNVTVYYGLLYSAIGNVGPFLLRRLYAACCRLVMFVMPVLVLHTVDVVTVQAFNVACNLFLSKAAVVR